MSDFLQATPVGTHWDRLSSLPSTHGVGYSQSSGYIIDPLLFPDSVIFAMDPSHFSSPNDEQYHHHLQQSSLEYGYPQSMLSRVAPPRRHTTEDDQVFDQRYLQVPSAHDRQWSLPVSHSYLHSHNGWHDIPASVPSMSSSFGHHPSYEAHPVPSLVDLQAHSSAIRPSPSPVASDRMCPPLRQRAQRTGQACENCRGRKTKCSGTRPVCERCATRGLPCRYPESKAQARRREASSNEASAPSASMSAPNLSTTQDLRASPRPAPASEPGTASVATSSRSQSSYFSPSLSVPSVPSADQSVIRYSFTPETSNLPAPMGSNPSSASSTSASTSEAHWPGQLMGYNCALSADETNVSCDSSSSYDTLSYLAASHTPSPHDASPSPRSPSLDAQKSQSQMHSSSTMPYLYTEGPAVATPEDSSVSSSSLWSQDSYEQSSHPELGTPVPDDLQWHMSPDNGSNNTFGVLGASGSGEENL